MRYLTFITLFPDPVAAYLECGILGRAEASGLVDFACVNPRDFAADRRGTVDDSPYGGGPGMVMKVAPLRAAVAAARSRCSAAAHVALMSPQGRVFDQGAVAELQEFAHLILVAGRYEAVDERFAERDIDSEWSIGDFILTGGELPALTIADALVRTLDGVLGDPESASEDSFSAGLLDHPHYTRPEKIDDQEVPAVLLSGDHQAIAEWRRAQALLRTASRRGDLLDNYPLSDDDRRLLEKFAHEPH